MLCVHIASSDSWAEVTVDQRGRGAWWVEQTHPLGNSEVVLKVNATALYLIPWTVVAVEASLLPRPSAVRGGLCSFPH